MVEGATARGIGESVPNEISSKPKSLPPRTVLRFTIERFAVVAKPPSEQLAVQNLLFFALSEL